MELTEQQKQEVKDAFKIRRNRQILISAPLVVLVFGFIFLEDQFKRGAFGISYDQAGFAFCGVVIFALIFSLKNWRCPSCQKYLGKSMNPKFCAKCGVPLQ